MKKEAIHSHQTLWIPKLAPPFRARSLMRRPCTRYVLRSYKMREAVSRNTTLGLSCNSREKVCAVGVHFSVKRRSYPTVSKSSRTWLIALCLSWSGFHRWGKWVRHTICPTATPWYSSTKLYTVLTYSTTCCTFANHSRVAAAVNVHWMDVSIQLGTG